MCYTMLTKLLTVPFVFYNIIYCTQSYPLELGLCNLLMFTSALWNIIIILINIIY